MKNKLIDVFKVANRLVAITVEDPDFSELKVNQFVKIGDKGYRVGSVPMVHSKTSSSVFEIDTFTMKIKEQTRKLATDSSKYCFEVADKTD